MKKLFGILALFIVVFSFTAWQEPKFISAYSVETLMVKIGLFGILGVGAAFVIITGGIDLSIGSVVGLTGTVITYLLTVKEFSPWAAIPIVIVSCSMLGLIHGLLITKLKLQPFVVTLCGLLIYRGVARFIAGNRSLGFGQYLESFSYYANGSIELPGTDYPLPIPFLILGILTAVGSVFLHSTVYGRYFLAIGRNEEAARYSGIHTDRMKILAYVLCSTLAGFGGILLAAEASAVQAASFGNFYELYAIAAAVLGGCSLTGGEGSILGVVLGTGVLRLLFKASNFLGISDDLEFAVVGVVLLIGAIIDEIAKRIVHRFRQSRQGS